MELWRCKHCGSLDYFTGTQRAYAELTVKLTRSPIKHEICLDCGTINRSYIEKPQKFRRFKEKSNTQPEL